MIMTFQANLKLFGTHNFKKNKMVRLVICGSVSSWIEKKTLKSRDFLGRIYLDLGVKELPLWACHEFLGKYKNKTSALFNWSYNAFLA